MSNKNTKKHKYSAKNDSAKKQKRLRKKRAKSFFAFLVCLLILAAFAFGIRYFLFETTLINSGALSPKYQKGDIVVINKLMDVSAVQRGDLVYASFAASGGKKLIRQVAGVAGDEIIEIATETEDGTNLNKRLIPADASDPIDLGPAEGLKGGILQEGQYLLLSVDMTDETALDSRQLGLVTAESFIGTPGRVLWPLSRMMK